MSYFGYVVELLLQKVQEHLCDFLLASGIKICIPVVFSRKGKVNPVL